jgi:F-type H+-transporting ATPase subunit delta
LAKKAYAKRYAQAVFQIALERGELDKWQSDLKKIASLSEDVAYIKLLESPKLRVSDKSKLISERFSDVSPLALNLVNLLVARERLGMVAEIAEDYERLLYSHRGIEPADVVTAVPLDEEEKRKLEERLSTIIGKKVVVKPEVDPTVVGGIVARVGGKLLDASTRSRLEALKRQIAGTEK